MVYNRSIANNEMNQRELLLNLVRRANALLREENQASQARKIELQIALTRAVDAAERELAPKGSVDECGWDPTLGPTC